MENGEFMEKGEGRREREDGEREKGEGRKRAIDPLIGVVVKTLIEELLSTFLKYERNKEKPQQQPR